MNRINFIIGIILGLFFNVSSFALVLNDNGQISATQVARVVHVKSANDILDAIKNANQAHLPIAIMGKQHSQGGHSLSPQAIELDMLSFNKILAINTNTKQITVECGITWANLQDYINHD